MSRRDATYWVQTADVRADATGAALREIFAEIRRIQTEWIDADELDEAKNAFAGSWLLLNTGRVGVVRELNFVPVRPGLRLPARHDGRDPWHDGRGHSASGTRILVFERPDSRGRRRQNRHREAVEVRRVAVTGGRLPSRIWPGWPRDR